MLWALAGVVLVCVLILAYQAIRAALALGSVRDDGHTLTKELDSGRLAAARRTVTALQKDAAHTRASGPLWSIAEHVPFIGSNFSAVSTTGNALDSIAHHSLPTLLTLADQVERGSLRPRHGRLDLHAVRRLAPRVASTARQVDGPASKVLGIHEGDLTWPVANVMSSVRSEIGGAKSAIDATSDAFRFLPGMLGAHGPRTYLLVVQNPAEIRAAGGLPGSIAVLHANHGRLSMGKQGSANMLSTTKPVLRPTRQEKRLFGASYGTDTRDVPANPDFPRVAQILAAQAAARGVHVDGVFSVDPVALSFVLHGTGGVHLPKVTLTPLNATQLLLNTAYRTLHSESAQNSFYASSARAVFNAVVGGQGNQVRAIRGLVLAAGERRVLAWSKQPQIDHAIARHKLSGGITLAPYAAPQVGLYLNDTVAGKMEYYLRHTANVQSLDCSSNGVQRLRLDATFRSTAPVNVISTDGFWVVGNGQHVTRGDIGVNAMIYSPLRGSIRSLRVDGKPVKVTSIRQDGHQVAQVWLKLQPGQVITVSGTLTTGPHQSADGILTSTPGMELTPDPSSFTSTCD